jgi:hypothetical protein
LAKKQLSVVVLITALEREEVRGQFEAVGFWEMYNRSQLCGGSVLD